MGSHPSHPLAPWLLLPSLRCSPQWGWYRRLSCSPKENRHTYSPGLTPLLSSSSTPTFSLSLSLSFTPGPTRAEWSRARTDHRPAPLCLNGIVSLSTVVPCFASHGSVRSASPMRLLQTASLFPALSRSLLAAMRHCRT